MPDYSACANNQCERKNSCCRYLMDVESYPESDQKQQSYFMFTDNGRYCDHYWPLSDGAPFRLKEPNTT